MSRFIAVENLSSYMCQLNSIALSLLCDHTSMKCVDSSTSFQFFSCPVRLIEELHINHPYHSLVIQTLQTFHNKYDGCSCKTLLFFLTTIYNHLQSIFDQNDKLFQKTIFNDLEQIIDQSIFVTQTEFSQNLSLNSDILHRLCRYQSTYSASLYQAYLHFISLKQPTSRSELLTHFDNLNHITRVKYSEEKCLFIPGTILPINTSIEGYRRTILIDGYLLEDYVHLGYNNKLKFEHLSTNSSWIYLILSILKKYSIEIILCSGEIDERLKNENMIFIENIPTKILRILGENSLLNYLTDLNSETNILLFNFLQFNDDPLLTVVEKGSTIIQYVPFEHLIDLKHEQFVHCLARFRHILQKECFLHGSGQFEDMLYQYWYNKRNDLFIENDLAYECFLECLQKFVKELSYRKECFETNLIDDFDSKFDAWKASIELLKILMQIDNVIQIVENENLSDI